MKLFLSVLIGTLLTTACLQQQLTPEPPPIVALPTQLIPTIASPTTPPTTAPTPTLSFSNTSTATLDASSGLVGTPDGVDPTKEPPSLPSQTATTTMGPDDWKKLPIFPKASQESKLIYQRGLTLGKNPRAFSKIGDCGSTPAWFLGDFDLGFEFYSLGRYQYLEAVIAHFAGSFGRTSLGARSGFNASSLMVSLWTNLTYCDVNETPLECEYRLHKPTFAFIMLGTNDIWNPDQFEPQMRNIIEFSIASGVVPILSTKADNEEGDGSINATISRLAMEYQVPLWNFWLAVQHLPNKGLQEDGVHLTWGRNFFDDPDDLSTAWTIRNLTALQVLDIVWQEVADQSE